MGAYSVNGLVASVSAVAFVAVIAFSWLDYRRRKKFSRQCVVDAMPDIPVFECRGWCSYFEDDFTFPCKVGVDGNTVYFSIRPLWLTRVLAPSSSKPVKLPLSELTFRNRVRFGQDVVQFQSTTHSFCFAVPLEVGRSIVAQAQQHT